MSGIHGLIMLFIGFRGESNDWILHSGDFCLLGSDFSFSGSGFICKRYYHACIFIGVTGMSVLRYLIIAALVTQIGQSEYYACTNDNNEVCACEENKRTGKLVIRCPTEKDRYLVEKDSERRKQQRYDRRQKHQIYWVNGVPIPVKKGGIGHGTQNNIADSNCYDSGWLRVCQD